MDHVTFVVFDDFQSLDLTGPLEVLNASARALGAPAYEMRVVGPGHDPVRSSSGLRFEVDGSVFEDAALDDGDLDTLIVAGGTGSLAAAADVELVTAIDRRASRARRVASVCSGAYVLAATGRLDGRRATTHWASCATLAERHPSIDLDPDAIFVRDGDVWTCAGVTAGMDLALALVTEDHGPDVAYSVASWLVMYVQRAGGQSQFSPQLVPAARAEPLRDLLDWIAADLSADLSVATLARRVSMSERHLTRLFVRELGTTPAAYVEGLRIDAARRLLQTTDLTVAAVAARVGFRSDAVLHRAFGRTVHTTPGTYRRHFSTSTPKG